MARPFLRRDLPPLLALVGLVAWVIAPGTAPACLPLLICPGWGLTRVLSVIDRGFGVLGSSLAGSWLVLGAAASVGARDVDHLGLAVHLATVGLCLAGRLRLARYDRWTAGQPEHPSPMPWLPARAPACLLVVGLALAAALHAEPPGRVGAGTARLEVADRALHFAPGAERPWTDLRAGDLHAAASSALSAAGGCHPVVGAQLLALAALVACLVLVAEAISRLWGNRGGTRAMLAFLLGLNPLAVWFLARSDGAGGVAERMGTSFAPGVVTALQPFVDGAPRALTLGCVAWLLSATLSVLRRSSRHVPRLMTVATLGLAWNDPAAAWLLLPGWLLGLRWSHVLCRGASDNDPHLGAAVRRAGEPRLLRAPFWRPALHLVAGAVPALWLLDVPLPTWSPSGLVTWTLLGAVGPGCLLFMPGVRHLNASPGREAYFFVGLLALAVPSALLWTAPPFGAGSSAALLALVLAVPSANGALKMTELFGQRARVALVAGCALAVLGPWAWLAEVTERPRVAIAVDADTLVAHHLPPALADALHEVTRRSPPDAALVLDAGLSGEQLLATELMARRVLLRPVERAVAAMAEGGLSQRRLRHEQDLGGRELWVVSERAGWPGCRVVTRVGRWHLLRQRPPDVVLVTVASLRDDRLVRAHMPALAERAARGLRLTTAITPQPLTGPGLASLMTGLSPVDHDVRGAGRQLSRDHGVLARAFGARGYRTAAVVALEDLAGLLEGFEDSEADPRLQAEAVVAAGLDQLARAERRPLFLWLHLSDLEPPYAVPADARSRETGSQPFPAGPLEDTWYGVASFPPRPSARPPASEVDVARGLAQYDALVGVLDRALARLLDSIPDDDLLVVTAPHGTSLDEHDAWFAHGPDLFEPSIRVPLVLTGAGLPAVEDDRLTALHDVAELLLEGRLPERDRVQLESGWRRGQATGRAYPADVDPTIRGAAPRIWGERTADAKTLLTRIASDGVRAAGVHFDLESDPQETDGSPADDYTLRRIDSWRRRGHPPSLDDAP